MFRQPSHGIEEAIGDGNCAFNAFILGLTQQSILDRIEKAFIQRNKKLDDELADFIAEVSKQFNTARNWQAAKAKLLALRYGSKQDKTDLQTKLAPFMRQMAVTLHHANPQQFCELTLSPLESAFGDYVFQQYGLDQASVADDVFTKHEFIRSQFKEWYDGVARDLSQEKIVDENKLNAAIEKYKEKLIAWWMGGEQNYQFFLANMNQHAEWAGDLELAALAKYFHVNVSVHRQSRVYRVVEQSDTLPTIELSNQSAAHWDNVAVFVQQQPQVSAPVNVSASDKTAANSTSDILSGLNTPVLTAADKLDMEKLAKGELSAQFDQAKFAALIKNAKREDRKNRRSQSSSTGNAQSDVVAYDLQKGAVTTNVLFVGKQTQIDLDGQLARQLQEQFAKEYQAEVREALKPKSKK